jgi:hypothetical protein
MTPKELATQFITDLEASDMSDNEAAAKLTNRIIALVQDYQAAAVQAEREACAAECERIGNESGNLNGRYLGCHEAAAAIRARSNNGAG